MKFFLIFGLIVAVSACMTTYVVPPDPTPVIGAELIGRSGECVDVQDGGTADGTPIVVVQCHGSPNERWFIKSGVISENYGSCLDVQGGAPNDGAAIVLVNCSGTSSQQWSIVAGQIIGLGKKCLTETGGITADQTPLILFSCTADAGHLWTVR
ncbi:MAG TPA: ricin-type beta-trefoil lectin domain protein [Steroidobacteraceae bacterium]